MNIQAEYTKTFSSKFPLIMKKIRKNKLYQEIQKCEIKNKIKFEKLETERFPPLTRLFH